MAEAGELAGLQLLEEQERLVLSTAARPLDLLSEAPAPCHRPVRRASRAPAADAVPPDPARVERVATYMQQLREKDADEISPHRSVM